MTADGISFPGYPVLLIDDDRELQRSYVHVLRAAGLRNIVSCLDGREAKALLGAREYGLVLLDINMPCVPAGEFLQLVREEQADLPVVLVGGSDDAARAIGYAGQGAFGCLVKPVDEQDLLRTVASAMQVVALRRENRRLRACLLSEGPARPEGFSPIVTADGAMLALLRYLDAVARTDDCIFLTGEPGVGKQRLAEAIHRLCGNGGSLVSVNVGGMDDRRLAQTLLDETQNGALFLGDIEDLQPDAQDRLLGFLRDRGHPQVIMAAGRSLDELEQAVDFSNDLLAFLRPHHVRVPPLRERMGDLPLLINHLLDRLAAETGKRRPAAPAGLFALLSTYSFPGNISELAGMLSISLDSHGPGALALEPFRHAIESAPPSPEPAGSGPGNEAARTAFAGAQPLPRMRECRSQLIAEALRRTNGNQTTAAELLGLTRQTLNRHLRESRQNRD